MTGLVFLHGWGYGPCVWDAWTEAFADRPTLQLDAGYFGPERMDLGALLPANADGWIGVGHSFGFAKLLSCNIPWRGLVGFGAFLRFCAKPGQNTGTPPELLDAMLVRLDVAPDEVLRRFTKRCGQQSPETATQDASGLRRLREDLLRLRDLDMQPLDSLPLPQKAPPILLLHAEDDRIVPLALAREAQSALHGSQLEVFKAGGHALPFTRTADCLPRVREFIHGLR